MGEDTACRSREKVWVPSPYSNSNDDPHAMVTGHLVRVARSSYHSRMKLREWEGKEVFRRYGIATPEGVVVTEAPGTLPLPFPVVVKAQVLSGDRKKAGGIRFAKNERELAREIARMLGKKLHKEVVTSVLIEEQISGAREYYVSFSYDDRTKGPVLALSTKGGSGIASARLLPIDPTVPLTAAKVRAHLLKARVAAPHQAALTKVVRQLFELFQTEGALLAEINPLFITKAGVAIAGDAKVITDDALTPVSECRNIEMDGDIAILASGGGASMLNMDALLRAGGRPANYTEYSGNPPAEVVRELTVRVLSREGLRGCWVVGAAANFTDIHTTLSGFLEGLRSITPKPTYPIVIRRDGPRREDAFEMLHEAGEKEGFSFYLFDAETPMVATAAIMVAHANKHRVKRKKKI